MSTVHEVLHDALSNIAEAENSDLELLLGVDLLQLQNIAHL